MNDSSMSKQPAETERVNIPVLFLAGSSERAEAKTVFSCSSDLPHWIKLMLGRHLLLSLIL